MCCTSHKKYIQFKLHFEENILLLIQKMKALAMKFVLILLFCIYQASSECCPGGYPYIFRITDQQTSCSGFDGADKFSYNNDARPHCRIRMCDDGTRRRGHYCGVGSCNAFGCDCDDGCRTGNPCELFMKKFAGKVAECVPE